MTYQVEFTKKASKQLAKLPRDIQQKIKSKVDELADNPLPSGIVKLEGNNVLIVFAWVAIAYYMKLKTIY